MCGIVGFMGADNRRDAGAVESILQRMANAIVHRGPDDAGTWHDAHGHVGFAHRRLSIVDLSAAGHQPMEAASGRYVLCYNGEIYNHQKIRSKLALEGCAPSWRGHSDTETLLAAFDAWGIERSLQEAVGMFAIAVWDRRDRVLTLARDRLGEKPLYYGWAQKAGVRSFVFSSELKALRHHPSFDPVVDREALCLLLRHNCVPAPRSIYKDIKKLLPGHVLTVSLASTQPVIKPYWSVISAVENGLSAPYPGSDAEAIDDLEMLLKQVIGDQMVADVPLGAFLSGGVDSSTVVAVMQSLSSRPIKTFTIGFDESSYNEAQHAFAVASHLGTEHTELYVSPEQALAVIPKLPEVYDEPFADSSQIPTFLVSQLARTHVTVSLSGDAGDELFCGYNRYAWARHLHSPIAKLPRFVRGAAGAAITGISPSRWDSLAAPLMRFLPPRARHSNIGDKLHKLSRLLEFNSVESLYFALTSHWENPSDVVIGSAEPSSTANELRAMSSGLGPAQAMMMLDLITYLPDDVLAKVDRASMAVSLESRVPFLDHRVVEFAWRLPHHMKFRDGVGKWVLRQVLYRHVPRNLVDRTKMGFGIPLDSWLRGPLREWAEELLDESRMRSEGFFTPEPIRRKWHEHLSGRRNWQHHLWDVLMFQAWLRHSTHD